MAVYYWSGLSVLSMSNCQFSFKAMGGPCQLTLVCDDQGKVEEVALAIESEVRRLEEKYSRFRHNSLLSRLNRGQLNGVELDKETKGLLNYVEQCVDLSGRLFDPTVEVLREAWNFKAKLPPKSHQVRALFHRIGWQKVKWDGVSLEIPDNMSLDLGGVVKEFAADRARAILTQHNMTGLVNLAGDITVYNTAENIIEWPIAVRHPRWSGAIASIAISHGAVAGSGDYERFIETASQRYCHILRPDTGFPAEDGLISVTVVADNCLMAGTVSTVAMLKGKDGLRWLEEMAVPYLAIDQKMKIYGTIEVRE